MAQESRICLYVLPGNYEVGSTAGRRVWNGIRMFNAKEKCYDMTYTCEKYMTRLRFVKDSGKLIGTVLDDPFQKWIFSDIQAESFHWQNITVLENGEWQVNSNVYAKRRK